MKILFIINHLKTGGAEKVLTLLTNSLSEHEHKITIAKFNKEEPFFELNNSVEVLNIKQTNSKINILAKIGGIKEIIKTTNPDVVISFTTTMNVYSIIAAKLLKKPIIVSEHTNYNRAKNNLWRYIRRVFYPFANRVVLLTHYDEKKYTFLKNKVVIRNPLILKNQHQNLKREKKILAVGRLHPVKGFDILIKSFANLKNKDWKLEILGEGPHREELQALISSYYLDERVKLCGNVKDVELYYKQASVYVLSSRAEGFPGTLCEAMGYGCPSIAFDCISGPNEIITDRVDGILVEKENSAKLTDAIDELIDNQILRENFEKQSKQIQNKLNIDKITKDWEREIEKAI